jgi:hypothetical protein
VHLLERHARAVYAISTAEDDYRMTSIANIEKGRLAFKDSRPDLSRRDMNASDDNMKILRGGQLAFKE